MGQLLSPETFEFFARYLVAGYIVIAVRARFVTGLRVKSGELIIEAFIFSLINQTLFALLAYLWLLMGLPTFDAAVTFYLEILVLPTMIGLLLGFNLSRGWNNAILRRLSAPILHPAEKAHDFAFGHNRPPGFVIITFEDGVVIRGYFGENSLAATDEARSDIYLERLYVVGEDDAWIEQSPGRSGLISLANVRSIEFLDEETNPDDQ
ncbi:DUF6338 family protein [Yoonia sp. 2307UL14-13]|uniref:DUF6338 family protein n=1 Tax=Yoonia sp. 2307UL14-13 TaxID=3126506 RepID=UPI0030AD2862